MTTEQWTIYDTPPIPMQATVRLNVRQEPAGVFLTTLTKGATVAMCGPAGENAEASGTMYKWVPVTFDGGQGWVARMYLESMP